MTAKIKLVLGLFFLTLLCTIKAHADDANPSTSDVLVNIFGLVKSWGSMGIYAGVAAALKLLIDGLKATGLWGKIPAQFQGLAVAGVAAVTVGLTTMAAGATLVQSVSAVLGSASGAMFLHELFEDFVPGAKKN